MRVALLAALLAFPAFAAEPAELPRCDFQPGAAAPTRNRPESAAHVDSQRFPLRVHVLDAAKLPEAERILAFAETAYEAYTVRLGFRAPLSDGGMGGSDAIDFYLVDTLAQGVGGYAGFSGFAGDDQLRAYGYLVLADNLDQRYARGVVAHEMFHLVQMAYSWWEGLSFAEGTATWAAEEAVDDENFTWLYFRYFNREPYRSPDDDNRIGGLFQYGSSMYWTFLDETSGRPAGMFVKAVLDEVAARATLAERHLYHALASVMGGESAVAATARKFGLWRVAVGTREDGHHFSEGTTWSGKLEPFIEASFAPGTTQAAGTTSADLQPFGNAYIALDVPEGVPFQKRLKLTVSAPAGASVTAELRTRAITGWHDVASTYTLHDGESATITLADTVPMMEAMVVLTHLPADVVSLDANGVRATAQVRYELTTD